MSAHTKGEWLQDGCTVYALNARGYKIFAATVQSAHTSNDAELVAVARLMKAAPDLLAALETLLNDPGEDQIRSTTWDKARVAIAQARGTP